MPPTWLPPSWDNHGDKHRPPPGIVWRKLVKETTGSPGYYLPTVTVQQQREWELRCIERTPDGMRYAHGNLITETNSKRTFWMDAGEVVGASAGVETRYIFVEWAVSGAVHGRPISPQELRRKGVDV